MSELPSTADMVPDMPGGPGSAITGLMMWSQIHQHMDPNTVRFNFGGGGDRAAGLYVPNDQGVVSGMFRVQRNFWP
jgi:hypothetical protein